jgi:ribosomal protein L1
MTAIRRARPPAVSRGGYLRRVTLAATMGPGVKVDTSAAYSMEQSAA